MSNLKILAVGDIHGESIENTEKFLDKKHDLLIILGDITQFGPPSRAEEILDEIQEFEIPSFCIPGNCDPKEVIDVLEKMNINLHKKSKKFEGYTFVGLGGSNKTPFSTPFELSEVRIKQELCKLIPEDKRKLLLITHSPPYGTKTDLTSNGTHAGSKSIRETIEERQPLINLCAHIHEARGIDEIGRTKIVNPGPVHNGFAVEVDLAGEKTDINLLKI